MAKLYEIDNAIAECIDAETGEILDVERLDSLTVEREVKIENLALWYKNLMSDAEAYKAEKNAFDEREQAAKKKAERIKNYIDYALAGTPMKTTKVAVTYRASETVVVDDLFNVPEKYLRYKEPEADKTAIKKAIKDGATVNGCHIEQKNNVSIK